MVRLRAAGGGLTQAGEGARGPKPVKSRLQEAARLYAQGGKQEAVDIYRDILREAPREAEALHMLGVAAQEAGNAELALRMTEAALRVRPGHAAAWFNRAVLLRQAKRLQEALQSAQMAVEADAELADAWDMLGQLHKYFMDYDRAAQCHMRAITLRPDKAPFRANYAQVLLVQGDKASALRELRRADALDPAFPPVMLGNVVKSLGYPEEAAALFARARALRPDYPEAAASEAMALLQMGEMARGWEAWERRPDFETKLHFIPLWQGHKVERLLLYEDQGLGDAIQFSRYAPLLRERADHITLRLRAPLRRLYAENFAGIDIVGEEDAVPNVHARCRLSSLPYFCAATLDTIPSAPYLTAQAERRAAWRERLRATAQPHSGPRIGLAWAGNARFPEDGIRSIPFAQCAPLLAHGGGRFVSLQKDRPADDAAVAASGMFDAAPLLRDFADTAALISELDLVVTVDTATAHLAGALGKPVFILLAFDSDWRWLLGRRDSPWYKSAKLYRQKQPRDWPGAVADVAADIGAWLAGDASILKPPAWSGESLRRNPDALPLPA